MENSDKEGGGGTLALVIDEEKCATTSIDGGR